MLPAMSPGVLMDQVLLILHRRQEISKIFDFQNKKNWSTSSISLTFNNVCSHEYQIIMSIIWKRINDTGKNWRHVYKVSIYIYITCFHQSFLGAWFFPWKVLDQTCHLSVIRITHKIPKVSCLDFLIRHVNNIEVYIIVENQICKNIINSSIQIEC